MGEVESPKLRFWYHVCIHINLDNGTVTAAVNGQTFRREEGKLYLAVRKFNFASLPPVAGLGIPVGAVAMLKSKKPETLEERIVLGAFNSTWGNLRTGRFQGSVSNIQVADHKEFLCQTFSLAVDKKCDHPRYMRGNPTWRILHCTPVTLRGG